MGRSRRKAAAYPASEELEKFAADIGKSVPEIVDGIARSWRGIPHSYAEKLRSGERVDATLSRIFEVSKIGGPIDEAIRGALKLQGYVLMDVDIDFENRHFFLDYEATTDTKANVDSVYLIIDAGQTQAQYSRTIQPLKLKREFRGMVRGFHDDLLDGVDGYEIEYDADDDSGWVTLSLDSETYQDMPDVMQVAQTLDRLEKFLKNQV